MNFLKHLFYTSIFTNLLIAGAAVAQCALSYLVFDMAVNPYMLCTEGAATLMLYNFSLFFSKPKNPENSKFARTRWFFKHEKWMWLNSAIAFGVLIYGVLHLHFYSIICLALTGVISLLYILPLYTSHGRKVGLRQIPGAKVFHIALIWVCSSVVLPAVEAYVTGYVLNRYILVFLLFLKFIFLIICTLPFDIRDIAQDSYYHLRTIPSMIGEIRAKKLCYLLLILHSALILIAPYTIVLKSGFLMTNFFIFMFLKKGVFNRPDHYHYAYLLDAGLILQFILVWISKAL